MKTLVIILFYCFLLASCKPKPTPLLTYEIKIFQKELDVIGTEMIDNVKSDTIMAINDTSAYDKAVLAFIALKETEAMLKNSVSKSDYFSLTDSLGTDVKSRLSVNVIDSLNNKWLSLRPELKKYLTK
ncbi:hypothetical protein [Pedobacter africanus]|uniref:DUF4296 domain-containing protein n=1 Tax=Pedobacter africanus TaxID=151894 RepID=A0A1W1ZD08_9SPHI|nr:hypothetical protein [Pedobacter africanus]SMC46320.1 hypothetical protein SAMN04488524_0614 [Pedobacter africanus]